MQGGIRKADDKGVFRPADGEQEDTGQTVGRQVQNEKIDMLKSKQQS